MAKAKDDLHEAIDALGSGEGNFTDGLKAVLHALAGGPVPHAPQTDDGGKDK